MGSPTRAARECSRCAAQARDWDTERCDACSEETKTVVRRECGASGASDRIDAAEQERVRLYEGLSDPSLLRDGAAVVATRAKLIEVEAEISMLIARWEALATIEADA